MPVKASIIVAAYNVGQYLSDCVDSIIASGIPDAEILLIDDGSTDQSAIICDHYASGHDNVTAYHKANGGLSDARNYGLERAKGEWIIFIDGDDCVKSKCFEFFLKTLYGLDKSIDVIFNDYILNNLKTEKETESQQIRPPTTSERVLKMRGTIWNVWRYAYKREFLSGHQLAFRLGYLAEDLDFTIKIWRINNVKMEFVHLPYYKYAYHRNGSITETASLRFVECMTELVREHFDKLRDRNDKITRLLRDKLKSDYIKHVAKYYYFDKDERKKVKWLYRAEGSPVPFNATLYALPLYWLRRIYAIGR
jgi:glycosyltransferase involved in cell wall biosynthesis